MIDRYFAARVRDNAPEIYTVVVLEFRETAFLRGNEPVPLGSKLGERHYNLSHAAVALNAQITEVLRSARNASPGEEITILYRRDINVVEVRMDGSLVYQDAHVAGDGPNWTLKAGQVVAVYLEPDGNGCYRTVMDGCGIALNHELWMHHLENRALTDLGHFTPEDHSVPSELRRLAEFCRKARPQCQVVITPQEDQTYLVDVSIPHPPCLLNRKIRVGEWRLATCSDDELWDVLKLLSFGEIKRPDGKSRDS